MKLLTQSLGEFLTFQVPSGGMSLWAKVRKDLAVEVRSREILYTTLFFALSCVLVFAVAFVREGKPLDQRSRLHPQFGIRRFPSLRQGAGALRNSMQESPPGFGNQ